MLEAQLGLDFQWYLEVAVVLLHQMPQLVQHAGEQNHRLPKGVFTQDFDPSHPFSPDKPFMRSSWLLLQLTQLWKSKCTSLALLNRPTPT